MKFQSRLDHYQNRAVRREYFLSNPRTDYDSLNENEKAWLKKFNEMLRQLEDKYLPIMDAKLRELQDRVANASDWLNDFNLSFFITFYLRGDDLEYDEDDDNILMEIDERFFSRERLDRDWGFGATNVDHAESCQDFPNERHCYLYHELYDHCYLDWRDLLRIGDLYVEIKIDEQSGMLPVI